MFKHFLLQLLEIEDEAEDHIHLDGVLTKHDLLELVEGQFVHTEADEVVEDCKEGGVVLAVGGGGEEGEDRVVGGLEEGAVSLTAIEDLSHKDPLGVFALDAP